MDRRHQYPFHTIEPKWQAAWRHARAYHTPNPGDPDFDPARPKYYVLDMFPYPSGAGLHVGHAEGYTATDIVARHKRMAGFNVLHPMGWDAFGLPAEQYAIKTGQHPRLTTQNNIATFKKQLDAVGFSYDWDREINTTDPRYFQWTQWIFLLLYNSWFDPDLQAARPIHELEETRALSHPHESPEERRLHLDSRRLAYVSEMPVNWCPGLGTVLANEEVIDGKSEVGGFPVERRPMRQWMLRITAYADRLIRDLDLVQWPESVKLLQRNWIGRSDGAEVRFPIPALPDASITVFTTRPDTLFGATYIVLAPEHPLVDLLATEPQRPAIAQYRRDISSKSDLDRTDLAKSKTGVFTGAHALNPVNNELIPIWIADYVLVTYGTGAIMAVPAHDQRDWDFAQQFQLPIRHVVAPADGSPLDPSACLPAHGLAINSAFLDHLPTPQAKTRISAWLQENNHGRPTTTYKLRDWLFSRQRYWGEPFPIAWQDGRHFALEPEQLPLLPPELDDFRPAGDGQPPLAKATEWLRYNDTGATRETNTMPQWAGSCWYYLRFCSPAHPTSFVHEDAERYWMKDGIDLYVGGVEHATLHLLYARFWHKVLHDHGLVSGPEPFRRLVNQGLILGEDNQKMSKSIGNVVNPDDVIADYGADSLRLFEMFLGPIEQSKPWSTTGVEGVHRFLARVWRLFVDENQEGEFTLSPKVTAQPPTRPQLKILHQTIRKVTDDLEALSFNTAIAQMMICVNALTRDDTRPAPLLADFLRLLSPFAPHITEELWQILNAAFPDIATGLLVHQNWPASDPAHLVADEIEIVIQVNGKNRDKLHLPPDTPAEQIEALALASPKVQEHTTGKTIRKIIQVPSRLINIVAT